MRGGTSFRRAVAASVGIHVLLAVGLVALIRWQATRQPDAPPRPGIDTRVDVRVTFAPAPEEEIAPVAAPPPSVPRPVPPPEPPPEPPVADAPDPTAPPVVAATPIPATLPPELLALLKRPPAPTADVVEVPITPGPIRPAGGSGSPAPPPVKPAAAWAAGGSPVHGALAPGQTVVYVLDASGSMGEWGKFDVARRALVATLRCQPEAVRFQVVVYAGTAFVPLPAPASGCVPATADNVTRMIDALRALGNPTGRSNHAAGVQKALGLRPDIVLIFTDAADLPVPALRGVVRQAAKPATVCVAKVAADGVGEPAEVK